MFGKSSAVQTMARAFAAHAAARQATAARNISNADTPGYRAAEVAGFAETYEDAGSFALRTTRAGHVGAGRATVEAAIRARPGEAAPNGNTVSIEREMLTAAEARQQHDMALAITKSLGGVIRTSLGRRA
jgi:flagellar basal-body rod protein FlgB